MVNVKQISDCRVDGTGVSKAHCGIEVKKKKKIRATLRREGRQELKMEDRLKMAAGGHGLR